MFLCIFRWCLLIIRKTYHQTIWVLAFLVTVGVLFGGCPTRHYKSSSQTILSHQTECNQNRFASHSQVLLWRKFTYQALRQKYWKASTVCNLLRQMNRVNPINDKCSSLKRDIKSYGNFTLCKSLACCHYFSRKSMFHLNRLNRPPLARFALPLAPTSSLPVEGMDRSPRKSVRSIWQINKIHF